MYQVISTLRVNVKSLAAEARIIRQQTNKEKNIQIKNSLHLHRVGSLRQEARHAQLALAAVRNIPYSILERNAKTEPNWKKIVQKVERHCSDEQVLERVRNWCTASKAAYGV